MMSLTNKSAAALTISIVIVFTACSNTPYSESSPESPVADADVHDAAADVDYDAMSDERVDDASTDANEDEWEPDVMPVAEEELVVLSLNLHCLSLDGTPYETDEQRFQQIALAAAEHEVTALALQEVCDDGTTVAFDELRRALEGTTGEAWDGHWAFAHTAWEGMPSEAEEGVALLARGGVADPFVLDHRAQAALRRVAVVATVSSSLGPIRIASIHLSHLDEDVQELQAREVAAVALAQTEPAFDVIVAGDFNAPLESATHEALLAAGFVDESTPLVPSRIDHVMNHRGAAIEAVEAILLFNEPTVRVSDHPAVLARYRSRAPTPVVITRITAELDAAFDRDLWIRGDSAPMSWDRGWPMVRVDAGRWRFVTTELSRSFEFKTLIDDTLWQVGPNEIGQSGDDVTVSPSFE